MSILIAIVAIAAIIVAVLLVASALAGENETSSTVRTNAAAATINPTTTERVREKLNV